MTYNQFQLSIWKKGDLAKKISESLESDGPINVILSGMRFAVFTIKLRRLIGIHTMIICDCSAIHDWQDKKEGQVGGKLGRIKYPWNKGQLLKERKKERKKERIQSLEYLKSGQKTRVLTIYVRR